MAKYGNVLDCIGNTPLILLQKLSPNGSEVYIKAESYNPGGSIKDRAAISMIRDAEARGVLKKGGSIVEPTSGNTGIGIAMVSAVLGYKAILVMPDTMSKERIAFIRAYGAEIVLTPGSEGMAGSVAKANEIAKETGAFLTLQFDNPANTDAHRKTTGIEILNDLPDVDVVFAGVGTGGTASGIGLAFKDANSKAIVIGVEPEESPLITQGKAGPHKIQGIGANFVPGNYNSESISKIITIKGDDAIAMTQRLAREEGIFAGISSGSAVVAAIRYAEEHKNVKVVAILPDSGDRYLSTGIFD